jgi:glycosyltransferase involved in cell wall biosynthesis
MGIEAHFVPSMVDVSAARTTSSRERVVLVNPREEHGVHVIPDLAQTFPTIEFILQESWPLNGSERETIEDILANHQNVWFRSRRSSPSEVFSDAAIVLAPHLIDNRPRTVLEALSNGIPVIASDLPGLVESVGPGGLIVDRAAGPVGWRDAVETLWQDPSIYRDLEQQARAYGSRPEVQPEHIVQTFLQQVGNAISINREQLQL